MALFPTLSYALAVDNPSEFINQLSHALLTTGFFYLSDIDQVIPEWKAAWDDVFKVSEQFFQLSLAEKMEIAMLNSRHFRGYSKLGSETTQGKQDLREQIDLAPPTAPLLEYPPKENDRIELSLYGPNQDPPAVPRFAPVINDWREICENISTTLVARIAESLTPHPELFTSLFKVISPDRPDYSRMKVVQYPPVEPGSPGLGVGAHKDGGGLTLLAQDNTGGLQVQNWSGEWINVEPKAYALVINVGQVIERMSASTYPATTHRVLPTLSSHPRISIPFFFCPPLDTALVPLLPHQLHPHLKNSAPKSTVSEVKSGDLHEEIFGIAAWRGITRSHHEVWEKFYGRRLDTIGGPGHIGVT